MADALTKSTSSILSSGLTTVIGFLALGLMRFKIGPDLGFALENGVAISLICVFIFMPCLIMLPMSVVFVIIIAPCYLASSSNDFYYGKYYPDSYYLAGEGISKYNLMYNVTKDMLTVNLITIAAVFIVLLLTMKSVSLPVILALALSMVMANPCNACSH